MKNDNNKNINNNENQDEYEEPIESYEELPVEDSSKKKKKLLALGGILAFAAISLFWIFKGDSDNSEKPRQTVNFADEFGNEKRKDDEKLDIMAPAIKNQFDINEITQPKTPEITQQPLEIKMPEQPKIEQIPKQIEIPKIEEVPIRKEETLVQPIQDKNLVETALPLILGFEEKKELPPLPTSGQVSTGSTSSSGNAGNAQSPENDYRARKRFANVLLIGGSGEGQTPESKEAEKKNEFIDLITGRTNKLHTKPSGFAKITDSYVGMKDRMILAGKIIDIVLESRISTASKEGGMIRAIVSSDVYSESGNNILIPAGSRVIGDYTNTKKKEGNATMLRVEVGLSRIIRPDGIDILLGGVPITDPLGGKGIVPDHIYTGVGKSIMNSVLVGALSLGAFYAGKAVDNSFADKKQPIIVNNFGTGNNGTQDKPQQDSTTDESNSTIKDIVDKVTENLKNTIGDGKDIEPVLVVDQGKKLSILMDKDIVFADENAFVFFPGELNSLLRDCCKDYLK